MSESNPVSKDEVKNNSRLSRRYLNFLGKGAAACLLVASGIVVPFRVGGFISNYRSGDVFPGDNPENYGLADRFTIIGFQTVRTLFGPIFDYDDSRQLEDLNRAAPGLMRDARATTRALEATSTPTPNPTNEAAVAGALATIASATQRINR